MNNPHLENQPAGNGIRAKTHEIIFGHHTRPGLWFDLLLLVAIAVSVIIVCLETVDQFEPMRDWFLYAEVGFALLFASEYAIRVWCVRFPTVYMFSFFGVVDLLAFLPSLIALGFYALGISTSDEIMSGTGSYAVIRSLRLLRVFRLLRIGKLEKESKELAEAIWNARTKVFVFLLTVLITVVIAGTLMYEIERVAAPDPSQDTHPLNGSNQDPLASEPASSEESDENQSQFESIPEGIYWAIVTMTTVGYGDIVPRTVVGRIVSSVLILIGYSLIIVPTGFVSAEVIGSKKKLMEEEIICGHCGLRSHDLDAVFCKSCGGKLDSN